MKIGPFHERDLPQIRKILSDLNVEFEEVCDSDRLEEQEESYGTKPLANYSGSTFDPSFIYLDIDDAEWTKIGDRLEKYGVVPPSDGHELDDVEDTEARPVPTWGRYSSVMMGLFFLALFFLFVYDKLKYLFTK